MIITDKNGRSRSIRTVEELEEIAGEAVAKCSPEEKKTILKIIEEMGQGKTTLLDHVDSHHWLRQPVSMAQFLTDPYYLGETGMNLYDKLKSALVSLADDSGYTEVILSGSTGWGKSFTASLLIAYSLYEISCLRDPALTFGLAPGSEIHFAVVSKNLEQTKRSLFAKVMEPLKISPYFQEHFWPKEKAYEAKFPKNVVMFIMSVGAQDRMLGANLFGAAIDEVDFLGAHSTARLETKTGYAGIGDKASALHAGIVRRIKSRFSDSGKIPGKVILISSKTVEGSFLDRRIRECSLDPSVYVLDHATWDVKPASHFSGKWFRVFVGGQGIRPRILEDAEELSETYLEETGSRIVDVPVEFRPEFESDIEAALRDVAGVSVQPVDQFFQDHSKLKAAVVEELEHPFSVEEWRYGEPGEFLWDRMVTRGTRKLQGGYEETVYRPIRQPDTSRHIHLDLGLTGDALGVAMGYIRRTVEVKRTSPEGRVYSELAPEFEYDFELRVLAPKHGEIMLDDVRALVYSLIDHGFRIRSASCDAFASEEMLQQFRRRGIRAEIISMDRDATHYVELRRAYTEGRIRKYHYRPAFQELTTLEFDRAKFKVDHPRGRSKDVSDAEAGVVAGLLKFANAGPIGMLVNSSEPQETDRDNDWFKQQPKRPLSPFILG